MFSAAKKTSVKAKMATKKKGSAEVSEASGSVKSTQKMALVAKKTTLKAKTLIDAMQTLNLIPSFSTSNFGGDILPENVLIRNILEGMVASIDTLARIIEELDKVEFMENELLKHIKPLLVRLKQAIKVVEGIDKDHSKSSIGLSVEDYDADTEGADAKHAKKYVILIFTLEALTCILNNDFQVKTP